MVTVDFELGEFQVGPELDSRPHYSKEFPFLDSVIVFRLGQDSADER